MNRSRKLESVNPFKLLSLGTTISAIGSVFTGLAIHLQLAGQQDMEIAYGLSFACGVLPGTLAAELAVRWSRHIRLQWLYLAAETLLILSLAVLLADPRSRAAMYGAISAASAAGGLLMPLLQTILKRSFADSEVEQGVRWSTLLFGVQFLVGNVVGAILISTIGMKPFLWLDLATSALSAALVLFLSLRFPAIFKSVEAAPAQALSMRKLSPAQQSAFFVYPGLALVCTPAMVLAPIKAAEFATGLNPFGLELPPYIIFFLARGLGQVLGPRVHARLPRIGEENQARVIALLLAIYLALYTAVFYGQSLLLSAGLILLAHVASNIVYVLSQSVLLREFKESEIGWISARSFQLSAVLMSLLGLATGTLKSALEYGGLLALNLLALILVAVLLGKSRVPTTVIEKEYRHA